jgi:hypothetical protein
MTTRLDGDLEEIKIENYDQNYVREFAEISDITGE